MKRTIRKVLCLLLLLLLFPMQTRGAVESETTAQSEKLRLDNENRYEGMEKAYQDGYEPEVSGESVSVILPLMWNGKNEVDTITASLDQGDQNTAPFIFQNYQKTFKKTEEKINDTEATKIEGTLKKDVLQKVLAESGMTETAAAMGVTEEQLADNVNAIMDAIRKAKPASAKGQYFRSVTLASTMGPGVKLSTAKYA